MLRILFFAVLAGVMFVNSGIARADDADPAVLKAGARVFNTCRACHVADAEQDSGLGPNLWATAGNKSAHRDDFDYSDAMKKANIVWTDENLDKWLASPKTFIAGNKMAFIGVPKEEDRKAVIAYLKTKK